MKKKVTNNKIQSKRVNKTNFKRKKQKYVDKSSFKNVRKLETNVVSGQNVKKITGSSSTSISKTKRLNKFINSNDTNEQGVVPNVSTPNKKFKQKKSKNVNSSRTEIQLNDNEDIKKNKKKQINLSLRERMVERLKSARFRYLNQQMYLSDNDNVKEIFETDPNAYQAYHQGFKNQIKQWPVNPLDIIIQNVEKKIEESKNLKIADFGCGEAFLSEKLCNKAKIFSLDLVAANDRVMACDMAHTNLYSNSIDIVVFCLSLMAQRISDYIREGHRVLKNDGIMKIAEVESRFDNVEQFIKDVKKFGFELIHKDLSHNMFYFMDFKKIGSISKKGKTKLPDITLKPCIYKKR